MRAMHVDSHSVLLTSFFKRKYNVNYTLEAVESV